MYVFVYIYGTPKILNERKWSDLFVIVFQYVKNSIIRDFSYFGVFRFTPQFDLRETLCYDEKIAYSEIVL